MRLPKVFGLGFAMSLALAVWACGAKTTAPRAMPTPPASEPAAAPTTPPTILDPPFSSPATTHPSRDIRDTAEAACELLPQSSQHVTTVALTDAVDPAHAPYPSNDSERLLFRQLYETLVRIDCEGRARPGLAASWRLDSSERSWIVTLREHARFSDGTAVTTSDIVSSWTHGADTDELLPRVKRHVESVVPITDRVMGIMLRSEDSDTPLVLADTALAVAKRLRGSPWPTGTRPSRIQDDRKPESRSAPRVIRISLVNVDSASSDGNGDVSSIQFIVAPDDDPRDLLDQGVDLLLTRDPAALNYADTLPHFMSVPLAWQRTHVFLSPRRSRAAQPLSSDARQTLAVDAVRGEAKGAEGPFWWEATPDCDLTRLPDDQPLAATGQIVYHQDDAAARDLAERFVGLATVAGSDGAKILNALAPGRPSQAFRRATGMSDEALAVALRSGTDTGYVVSLKRRALDPCREVKALVDRAEWLGVEAIVPLVETRLRALVRRNLSGVTVDWDGGLVISAAEGER